MKSSFICIAFVLAVCAIVGCGDSKAANQIDVSDEAAVKQHMQQVDDEERAHFQQNAATKPVGQ